MYDDEQGAKRIICLVFDLGATHEPVWLVDFGLSHHRCTICLWVFRMGIFDNDRVYSALVSLSLGHMRLQKAC